MRTLEEVVGSCPGRSEQADIKQDGEMQEVNGRCGHRADQQLSMLTPSGDFLSQPLKVEFVLFDLCFNSVL